MRNKADEVPEIDPYANPLARLALNSCAVGCHKDAPQKLWILRLIDEARNGNNEAVEYLDGIISHVEMLAALSGFSLPILSQEEFDEISPRGESRRFDFQMVTYPNKARFVVPKEYKPFIEAHLARKVKQTKNDLDRAEQFSEWFFRNTTQIAEVFDQRMRDIQEKPRYGILPFGQDSVIVKVSPLKVIGICSFAFHPEGKESPEVKLSITVRKSGAGLCTLWALFRNFSLECTDHLLDNWQGYDLDYLRSVFEYVIVDTMHRIICHDPVQNVDGEDISRKRCIDSTPKKSVVVRPLLRRLPTGYRASSDAKKRAFADMGWLLPEGVTFVRSHHRWMEMPEGKRAPLFSYTDEMFMKSIE